MVEKNPLSFWGRVDSLRRFDLHGVFESYLCLIIIRYSTLLDAIIGYDRM